MDAVVATGASVNIGAPPDLVSQGRWVSQVQTKLHCWAAADPDRRIDDLFNLVHHPATLAYAWARVARNRGARSAGSDGVTVARIEADVGVSVFLDDLRDQLREGPFHPQPVRERKIPKPGGSGKVRRLGIPTVTDRVVQAALKLVLDPIFEADFVRSRMVFGRFVPGAGSTLGVVAEGVGLGENFGGRRSWFLGLVSISAGSGAACACR